MRIAPRHWRGGCDILVPAALESQINAANVMRIQARLIVEAVNGPATYKADQMPRDRGVTILPDVFVNAGGVTVCYFEWTRNLSHMRFGRLQRRDDEWRGRDLVRSGLDDTMPTAFQDIREMMKH